MTHDVPPAPSASAWHGFWFVFHHSGHDIGLWVSSLSGKEELYVNGSLEAVRRKIGLTSTHEFDVGGVNYSLSLSIKNMRRGVYQCVLYENGIPVSGLETEYITRQKRLQGAATIVGVALVVFLVLRSTLSILQGALAVAVVAGLIFALFGRQGGYAIRSMPSPLPRNGQEAK